MPGVSIARDESELRAIFVEAGGLEGGGLDAAEFPGALKRLGLPVDGIAYVTELRTSADSDRSGTSV